MLVCPKVHMREYRYMGIFMKVSVILPIYKVDKFIARCATSLMEQTLQDVEYIFVDDATPDRSIELLEEVIGQYPERKGQVRLLKHQTNKGLPAVRRMLLFIIMDGCSISCWMLSIYNQIVSLEAIVYLIIN